MAVWSQFGYHSLYDEATGNTDALDDDDVAIFNALQTRNFEGVLRGLRTASVVDSALGLDVGLHLERYNSIREALVAAVHSVHIPWGDLPSEALRQIKRELLHYNSVFTTNYDLIAYWAAMCDDEPGGIPDYFWSKPLAFDPLNTEVWGKATKLLFLHGGLHLYKLSNGQTLKRTAQPGKNLLELFGEPLDADEGAVPLFVSEGEAADKLAAIRASDYLTFALTEFASADVPLVIFGHSLSEQDQHLVDILRGRQARTAVSLRKAAPRDVLAAKAGVRNRLSDSDVIFFDAATHPLGASSLSAG
jgi:Domain of unknown function (DUF4917)